MAAIRGYEKTYLAPMGMKLGFAGDVAAVARKSQPASPGAVGVK